MSLTPTDLKIIGVTEHDLIQALESVEQEMTVDEPAYDPMQKFTAEVNESKGAYLNGVQVQTKARFFPKIAEKTEKSHFNNLVATSNMAPSGNQTF